MSVLPLTGNAKSIADFFETAKRDGQYMKSNITLSGLRNIFLSPLDEAKASCYWWWFNGLVDHEGITRDLEEFRKQGIGRVLLINTKDGLQGVTMPLGVKLLSPEWRALYKHAIREAARLKIEVGVNLSSGWCMGGPWIKPENAGRWVLQSELKVTGPRRFSEKLPLPGNRHGYDDVFSPPGYLEYIDLPIEKLDYRDTIIVAFPDNDGDASRLSDDRGKELLSAKTNRKDARSRAKAVDVMAPTLVRWNDSNEDKPIPVHRVIDLTSFVSADGHLEWDVPPGKWSIIRTGHRITGSKLLIAQPEADGLSIDWFAPEGLDLQFENMGRILMEDAAEIENNTLKYFHNDSFEDGFPNWTEKIIERFKEYRGYDPMPYFPVFSSVIVGSAEISDRFLHDYRKTIADCMADQHYKHFADLCHQNGLLVQNEAAGPSRSGSICMDGLKNLGRSDYPMGEFWLGPNHDEEGGLDEKLSYSLTRLEGGQNKVTKMVASAAHVYGKKIVSAEAYTSHRHWLDTPETLKQSTDRAFCEGINRLVIHTSTATRPRDGKPGYEYGAGTHFNPNVTWWDKSGSFLSYIARCQGLLQAGKFTADVLYYNGDWAPNLVSPKHVDPSLGKGYDYDVCNEEVLLTRLSVKNKALVLPDGMRYRMLVLPDDPRMPAPVINKIRELVKSGATVVGSRPESDPGLKNFPECDDEVRRIADEVWSDCDGETVLRNSFGKGRIIQGVSLREILLKDGIMPDFEYSGDGETFIDSIHRTMDDGTEIYFLTNRNKRMEKVNCLFCNSGKYIEIWDPVSGGMFPITPFEKKNRQTILTLEFFPHQSFFIVFPANGNFSASKTNENTFIFPQTNLVQMIDGSWQVKFDTEWGGPAVTEFDELVDWSKSADDRIKYFSGKATYLKRFDLDRPADPNTKLFLDLGLVKNIAEVKLNGQNLGVIWTAPWRVDISKVIKGRDNLLEIEVINLWPNRLIGDASLPEDKRLTKTNIKFDANAPLLSSGLLGPVVIKSA